MSVGSVGSSPFTNTQLTQPDDSTNANLQSQEQQFFQGSDYQDQLKWFLSDALANGATDPDHLGKLKGTIGAALIAHLAETNPALLNQLFADASQQPPAASAPPAGGGSTTQPNSSGGAGSGGAGGASAQPTGSGGGTTSAGTGGAGSSNTGDGTSDNSGSVARGNPTADTYAQQNGQVTKDGSYTEAQCEQDIKNLANANGKPLPDAATITKIATGIIKGINANFSGVNTIGDFSKYSGAKMGKLLVSSAYQESDFGLYGEDAGGIFQCAPIRLQQYNQANGTNYTEDQLKADPDLACDVGIWAMSTVEGTLGQQAPGTPAAIPSDLGMQALYYWNYHGGSGHGHADELSDYMSSAQTNLATLEG